MQMTTTFQLQDEVNVRPTMGLDAARGTVCIVAIACFEGVPANQPVETYVDSDAGLRAEAWYGFRYLDERLHADNGVTYLPESLFQEIVAES